MGGCSRRDGRMINGEDRGREEEDGLSHQRDGEEDREEVGVWGGEGGGRVGEGGGLGGGRGGGGAGF